MDSVLELQTHGKLLEEAPSEATLAAIVMESNVSTGKLQKSQTEEVPMAGMPLMASCAGRVLELVLGLRDLTEHRRSSEPTSQRCPAESCVAFHGNLDSAGLHECAHRRSTECGLQAEVF